MSGATDAEFPEMSGLESVQSRAGVGFAIRLYLVALILAFVLPALWLVVRYREFMDGVLYAYAVVGVLLAIALYYTVHLLTEWTTAETSPHGLTLGHPLRRRFVPWESITEAFPARTRLGVRALRLKSARGMITLPLVTNTPFTPKLVASIRQHLLRKGVGESIELDNEARRLWKPVPESVPYVAEWSEAKRTRRRRVLFVVMMFVLLLIFCAAVVSVRDAEDAMGVSLLALMCGGLAAVGVPSHRSSPTHVKVGSDSLSIVTRSGERNVPWGEIVGVEEALSGLTLRVRGSRAPLSLPLVRGDEASERMVLAAVRHLRAAGVAVALPVTRMGDPDILSWPLSHEIRRAHYLRTLDQDQQRRLKRAENLESVLPLIWLVLFAGLGFSPLPEHLMRLLYWREGTMFLLVPDSLLLGLPCAYLGLAGLGLLTGQPASEAADELSTIRRKLRRTPQRAEVRLLAFFACVAAVGLLLCLISFTRLSPSGITTRGPRLLLGATHSWREVTSVNEQRRSVLRNGQYRERTSWVIRFSDGTVWECSDLSIIRTFPGDVEAAMRYAARKAGVEIESTYTDGD